MTLSFVGLLLPSPRFVSVDREQTCATYGSSVALSSRSSPFVRSRINPSLDLGRIYSSPKCRSSQRITMSVAMPSVVSRKIRVGVLGCTGSVGQRFIQLLANHPWFEVAALGASERSAGKIYASACKWKQATPIPAAVVGMPVSECVPGVGGFASSNDIQIVFSGLDADYAGDIEEQFAKAGYAVFSNAKNHRMDPDVPILIPPVNADHLHIIPAQRKARGYDRGFIVTNANCSVTALTIGLKPIFNAFGIETIMVSTMQAISGAGYPGIPSMDMLDNVVPYIGGEEQKMETEAQKILGTIENGIFVPKTMKISAMCNRVHVLDGHTECVSLKLTKPASPQEAIEVIRSFPPVTKGLGLPSAPFRDVIYLDAQDRPQPRLDRNTGNGFTVTVGRLRECNVFDLRLVVFGHNTIIGAAGGSIMNAELCVNKGLIDSEFVTPSAVEILASQ